MNYGLGGSYLIPFRDTSFAFGISSEINIARQMNAPSGTGGVYSGMRWNIFAPTASFQMGPWIALAEFEFLGNYTFSTPSLTGSTVSYRSPLGEKLKVLKEFTSQWSAGIEYETLSFGSKNGNALVNREGYWQFSALATYGF